MPRTLALTREQQLRFDVEVLLPEFARMCAGDLPAVIMHQAAFAADYQMEEFLLLGKAIKYAGLFGKELYIVPGPAEPRELVQ